MISMPSESWLSLLCKHRYADMILVQLTIDIAPETVTTAKWQMSWKENSSLLRLWPYQGMKHTVSQNGEFIARYC